MASAAELGMKLEYCIWGRVGKDENKGDRNCPEERIMVTVGVKTRGLLGFSEIYPVDIIYFQCQIQQCTLINYKINRK